MNTKTIGIALALVILVGGAFAAGKFIKNDYGQILEKDLTMINNNIDFFSSQVDLFQAKKDESKSQYQEKTCQLAAHKLANNQDIKPETYSLCSVRWKKDINTDSVGK